MRNIPRVKDVSQHLRIDNIGGGSVVGTFREEDFDSVSRGATGKSDIELAMREDGDTQIQTNMCD